jgi:hypothetical protein
MEIEFVLSPFYFMFNDSVSIFIFFWLQKYILLVRFFDDGVSIEVVFSGKGK